MPRKTVGISAREAEILTLMANGNTLEEAAAELGIARYTVKSHLARIAARLGAKNTTHSVVIALRHDWIEL